jgi:MFS family permease
MPMSSAAPQRWYRELTRYHWFVLTVAALGWLFDTMDQQLFTLARVPAMRELLAETPQPSPRPAGGEKGMAEAASPSPQPSPEGRGRAEGAPAGTQDRKAQEAKLKDDRLKKRVDFYGGVATSVFLIGWATGGLAFGVLGDRIGRAKVMLLTILVYSLFTGLSALSVSVWDFMLYRFLTGLGVGGEFAVGVALVAEVMPDRARSHALGLLQALSAVGNITAALVNMGLGIAEGQGVFQEIPFGGEPIRAWRLMFVVGTVPALLAVFIRRRLKEPERWQRQAAGHAAPELGSYRELFGHPRWRHNALVGLALAFSGVVGLWGIGFFSPDLVDSSIRSKFASLEQDSPELNSQLAYWKSMALILQNLGGALGIYAYSKLTPHLGRRLPFAVFFVLAGLSTVYVFLNLDEFGEMFWMLPLMGFCQLALFGGYAIYFPELFPTRLRSTGTSFCYNVGRFVAAIGPFTFGYLASGLYGHLGSVDPSLPKRYAGVTMCGVFLIGLVALPFAPETKDKPLPE